MANIATNAKAAGIALALGTLTGATPTYQEDSTGRVRIYWTKEQLPAVQDWFKRTANAPGGDLSLDFLPVAYPWIIPKVLPIALGVLLGAYLLGKLT